MIHTHIRYCLHVFLQTHGRISHFHLLRTYPRARTRVGIFSYPQPDTARIRQKRKPRDMGHPRVLESSCLPWTTITLQPEKSLLFVADLPGRD